MANTKFNLGELISQRTKSEKTLGLIAALTVFVGLVYGLVISPIMNKMTAIDTNISTSRDEIRRDRRILSFRNRILEEYAKSNSYLDSSQKSSEEIIATLLKKIEGVAKDNSITIRDIRPGETEVKPQFKVYKTSMDCEGTLANLLALMNTLEQSDYLFQITRYSFEPKSRGADILKASFDIARYLIPAEKMDSSVMEGFAASAEPAPVDSLAPATSEMPAFPDLTSEEFELKNS